MKTIKLVTVFLVLNLLNGCDSNEEKAPQIATEITTQTEKPVVVSEPTAGKKEIAADKKQINPGLFFLTENEEHYMPQMIKAAQLVVKDAECLEITFGGVGVAGQYVDIPEKTGVLFYFTCRVSDLPNEEYDNFWVSPDELTNSKAIYRQHGIK